MNFALAHVADSRDDYYQQRQAMATREIESLGWLRSLGCGTESGVIRTLTAADDFVRAALAANAEAVVIHLPIWADPELALRIAYRSKLPVLLLGNRLSNTSSVVGLLGAAGAMDQIGLKNVRVFYQGPEDQNTVLAFLSAAHAVETLSGERMLRFGSCSLGILTAEPDLVNYQKKLGVFVEQEDERLLIERAEAIDEKEVRRYREFLTTHGHIELSDRFPAAAFDRQIRSYLALKQIVRERSISFVGVKCQKVLSDGYVCQCLSHCLMNGTVDADGVKEPMVFACESDANGAVTMRILQLVSGGKPASLLDVRTLNTRTGRLIVGNCGAVAEDMVRTQEDKPFSGLDMISHAFGAGQGGAMRGQLNSGKITAARLCVKDGTLWLAAFSGNVVPLTQEEKALIPPSFPGCAIETGLGEDFLREFGSNHMHLVYDDALEKLRFFCMLAGIPMKTF